MASQGTNSEIEEYDSFIYDHDLFNYNGSVFRGGIPDQDEPSSKYELKSGEFKANPENDNILSSDEKIRKILGLQTETEHKNSEENNIINGIQEKKESKEEDKKNIHFITTKYNNRGKAKKKNYLQKTKEKDRIQKRIQIILKTKLSHIS